MARRVDEAALGTRTARQRLAPRHTPYFRLISDGLHLGYRRSTVTGRAGAWLVRRYVKEIGYQTKHLGTADDSPDLAANGIDILTFDQALTNARNWMRQQQAAEQAADEKSKIVTVRSAVDDYIAIRCETGRRTGKDAKCRLRHHVLSAPLADVVLSELKDEDFANWRASLTRGGRSKSKTPLTAATVARLFNDLRAALTAAASKRKLSSLVQATIKEGLKAPKIAKRARDLQLLEPSDIRKIIDIASTLDADFGHMVLLMAVTGARMDQLSRCTVASLQVQKQRLMVPRSMKGRGEKEIPNVAIPLPAEALAKLTPLTKGRAGTAPLLMRWHHEQVRGDKQTGTAPRWERVERRQWSDASQMARRWRETLQLAELPSNIVPYSLRHSSIVRALQAGLPVRLVAAAHDTSVAMIEQHYSAYIVDASEELLRRAMLGMVAG